MADGLILPVLALGLLGWIVPRLLARALPEGARPLLANAALSGFLMLLLAMAVFVALYRWQGAPVMPILEQGAGPVLRHFGGLALQSALIWAPVMALSLAGLPRHWVKETW